MTPSPDSVHRAPLRIVALAPNDWYGEWFNRQHLLSRIARHHPVVYSNGLWYTWERRSAAYRASPLLSKFEQRDGVVQHRRGRLVMRIPRFPTWDRCAIRRTCRQLKGRLPPGPGPLVAHVFNPEFLSYVEALAADYVVYHAYDLFRAMLDAPPSLVHDENMLTERADLVIATSPETAQDLNRRTGRDVVVLGNGVDWARFDVPASPPEPVEFAGIPHPRVGYVGTMNPKVDFELIAELARRRPGWQFLLVGPIRNLRPVDEATFVQLRQCGNVRILDGVPQHRVGEFLFHVDAGIIPYRMAMGWPAAGYPLKMLEYLACGLPVVSAPLATAREFSDSVALATSTDEWDAALQQAIDAGGLGTRATRQAVARANSWDARAARLEYLLQDMAARPARQAPTG